MPGIQPRARTRGHRDAVVAILVDQDLRDAAVLAAGLHHMLRVDALGLPQAQAHAAEIVVADARDQRHPRALARGSHGRIAALATRADAEGAGHLGLAARQGPWRTRETRSAFQLATQTTRR